MRHAGLCSHTSHLTLFSTTIASNSRGRIEITSASDAAASGRSETKMGVLNDQQQEPRTKRKTTLLLGLPLRYTWDATATGTGGWAAAGGAGSLCSAGAAPLT
jgi:hypothetical protein